MPDAEEEYTNKTIDEGWQHCLTVPRELRVKDGKKYLFVLNYDKEPQKIVLKEAVMDMGVMPGEMEVTASIRIEFALFPKQ